MLPPHLPLCTLLYKKSETNCAVHEVCIHFFKAFFPPPAPRSQASNIASGGQRGGGTPILLLYIEHLAWTFSRVSPIAPNTKSSSSHHQKVTKKYGRRTVRYRKRSTAVRIVTVTYVFGGMTQKTPPWLGCFLFCFPVQCLIFGLTVCLFVYVCCCSTVSYHKTDERETKYFIYFTHR